MDGLNREHVGKGVALNASPCRPPILLFWISLQACTTNVGLSLAKDTELQEKSLVLNATDLLDILQLQLEKTGSGSSKLGRGCVRIP